MMFTASVITAWLAISSIPAMPSDILVSAFITPYRSRHLSHLSTLHEKKFDAVLTTKRNKDLGYDDRSGRFFEVKSSKSNLSSSKTSRVHDNFEVSMSRTSKAESDSPRMDVPPMPEAGFVGMNVTGEINGVKMTSSKRSSKRKNNDDRNKEQVPQAPVAKSSKPKSRNKFAEQIASSGAVSAAAMATAAVNAAVSMKTLTAPSVDKSYISLDLSSKTATDEEGLPLVYDKDLIESYWRNN